MVLAEQHEADVPSAPDEPVSPRTIGWPSPAELRQSAPILRLLAETWAIPRVSKIGITLDQVEVQVWVFLPEDDREAESKILAAERAYLNSTPLHQFTLDVVPLAGLAEGILPPFETVLER